MTIQQLEGSVLRTVVIIVLAENLIRFRDELHLIKISYSVKGKFTFNIVRLEYLINIVIK